MSRRIAHGMAQAIVNDLEPVEVEKQHRKLIIRSPQLFGRFRALSRRSVNRVRLGKLGEPIVQGIVNELFSARLRSLISVTMPSMRMETASLVRHNDSAAVAHPANVPTGPADAVFQCPDSPRLGDGAHHLPALPDRSSGWMVVNQSSAVNQKVFCRALKQPCRCRIQVQDLKRLDGCRPDDILQGVQNAFQALFAGLSDR
jgi:hypothetical protein